VFGTLMFMLLVHRPAPTTGSGGAAAIVTVDGVADANAALAAEHDDTEATQRAAAITLMSLLSGVIGLMFIVRCFCLRRSRAWRVRGTSFA
jgi:hypothetical protein